MSIVNEDVLWLEPLLFFDNFTIMESEFDNQLASSNISSSSSLSVFSASVTTMSSILSPQNRFPVLKWSVRIIGGLLIVIGGIGNTLSALTLSRKKLRAQVTSIYLIALALSDLGNVFFSVLNFYLVRLDPDQNMRLYSNIACKLHIFFTYYFINLSPTLLVAVSVQRYLAIAKHHYAKRHCTVKNAYMIIGLICLVSLFIQLHWGIFYELMLVPKSPLPGSFNITRQYRRVCNISSNYPSYLWFRSRMLGYIQWFFYTLCPFITMLILNSLILKVIASARRIQQRMNQKNQRKKAKQRNMTIMLLSVSCVFILLTAPASTFMAFGHLFKNLHGPNSQSLWTMFSLIYYANTAANFLLYFLTANVFRQELRVMILSVPGCTKLLPSNFLRDTNHGVMSEPARGAINILTGVTTKSALKTAFLDSNQKTEAEKSLNDHQRSSGNNLLVGNQTKNLIDRSTNDHRSVVNRSNDEDSPL